MKNKEIKIVQLDKEEVRISMKTYMNSLERTEAEKSVILLKSDPELRNDVRLLY